jgi:hypothetical protein
VPIAETGLVAERVRVRGIDDDEGRRLVRIVRRDRRSVVTWRRAQMVLLSAQGTAADSIAKVACTSEDRVRDVIHIFNADGFDSLDHLRQLLTPPDHPQRQARRAVGGAEQCGDRPHPDERVLAEQRSLMRH